MEQEGSQQFQKEFGVNAQDVSIGGIIIGSNKTKVKGKIEEAKKDVLYERAINSKKILYDPAGIRLMTWDHVLDQLKPKETQNVISSAEVTMEAPKIPKNTVRTFTTVVQMPKLSGQDVMKILCNKFGFKVISYRGSHSALINQRKHPPKLVSIYMHEELSYGALNAILEAADISREEFLKNF
jgi:predicted RNA binding protein YcfA (HicA-like mRNA interferase family)